MTPEQVREQMVDYLYGELEGDALRAFEAALESSDEHRRTLSELSRTLGLARATLARELSEEAPARVRERVLAAARASVDAGAEPRGEATMGRAGEHAERARVSPRSRGAWERLRAIFTHPALYPAVGFAAAIAVVVVMDRRERATEEQRDAREAESASPAASAERAQTDEEPDPPPASEPAPTEARSPRVEARRASTPAEASRARSTAAPASAGRGGAQRRAAPAREYASPPPARAERSFEEAEERPRPFPSAPEKAEESEGRDLAADARHASPSAAASPALGAGAAPGEAPPAASSKAHAKRAAGQSDREAHADDRDALVRRAAQHLRAQRLEQAAASYRELLRRYPDDAQAPAWRSALTRIERALRPDGGDAS